LQATLENFDLLNQDSLENRQKGFCGEIFRGNLKKYLGKSEKKTERLETEN
jgi:hypothetical protein